jgi:hypothetical protein
MNRSLLVIACALAGCGGGASNSLGGSVKSSYNLDFDQVQILKQVYGGEFKAIHVRYVSQPGSSKEQTPVKVTVNAPIVVGQPKDLKTEGTVVHLVSQGGDFPKVKQGNITFSELGDVGKTAAGKFYVTFVADPVSGVKTEGTLDGEFSATLQLQQ